MNNLALGFTVAFVAVAIVLSMWQRLGLEREILVSTVRCAVQLLLVGYVLHYVFQSRNPLLLLLILGIMTTVAAWNAGQRAKGLAGIRWRVWLALVVTETVTMSMMVGLDIIEPVPQYIIPISGMIIGNAMVVSGLLLNQMKREVEASKGEIETLLALGATARQAIQRSLKRSVRASMIPTIDAMKTTGLVQLPGMMTGMIIAGADPVEAVRYQILILFTITASAAITSIILSTLSYKLWFTEDERLLPAG
ncbi:ABC transporter permease [Paenibacillus xerothermodurans]|uniref:Iron export ABC transporter permease subunit FetB n=1 Tax=Paenibacillus xerothermodurans TaxID=1977292 RepID=A0A2W1P437_PAEXE|nr:iron export ABC transporter permease subunit FetB [Paenibacillus xerothermodurans]PZE21888.1 iron export ABC transporter permease subunit FetB [Paenibacillus xerothermodurans]